MNPRYTLRIVAFMARINSSILAFRVAVAAEEGGDIEAILAAADAPQGIMQGNPPYTDLATERRIWRAIVEATGREDIGLVCGQRFPTQAMGILGYVCANAPTLHVAIEKSCQYARIMGDSMGGHIERGSRQTKVWIEQWTEWHDPLRYTVDCFVAANVAWASANAPRPVRPKEIGFHYTRPKDTLAHESAFPTAQVKFETDVSYQIYDNDDLDQPVIGANLDLFRDFEDRVQAVLSSIDRSQPWSERVRRSVVSSLKGSTPTLQSIASDLAVGARTLQLRLGEEGTSFSEVLTDAREN
ncbi:MAG: AraC family transcriptional regulator ligand-binding domain-containing protein, partial [Pseudomonadota bacterium]